jgi:exodeoxyribonuclease VII large subunit
MTDADALDPPATNAEPYSVSELAFALKRTIESAYGYVRLRGELSKVTFHGNGHVYLDLKDDKACISGVIWKPTVRGLEIRPETGLEVIVTGRVTTYPGRSQYQIVIETMSPAGIGALLAQLERLKARLSAEGLFDTTRKRPLPAMPRVIGVVTSPTGAVIRDILHRLAERWPCRVLVWPVVVQGDQAAAQVRAAIEGFAALPPDGPAPRPDLVIVARGGGSVEDLWPFNDEALVRAAAASPIPLVSAVGHETDTTLIDFVADRRAPTPTAAAEIATPVRAELLAALSDRERRMSAGARRQADHARVRLAAAVARLPRAGDLLALATQRVDMAAGRLDAALGADVAAHQHRFASVAGKLTRRQFEWALEAKAHSLVLARRRLDEALKTNVAIHRQELTSVGARLRPRMLQRHLEERGRGVEALGARLEPLARRALVQADERMSRLARVHASLDPTGPLRRGFAMVRRGDGRLARSAGALSAGESIHLQFHDGERMAVVEGSSARPRRQVSPDTGQGRLF